jgi:hypothetical protein
MRNLTVVCFCILLSSAAYAQQSLQQQIDAVDRVNQADIAAREQQQRQMQSEQRLAQQKRDAEIQQAKAHNQAYEDQERELQLEEQKTKLAVMKAKANRANDYIDQELNQEKAKTDVIQSDADANRNISQGEKSLMGGVGEGAAKKGSWWQ